MGAWPLTIEDISIQVPLEIRFHNLDPSPAIETAVRERATKLERYAADIISCRVTVEAPHKQHRRGNLYHVTVDVHVPGAELVASRDVPNYHAHEDLYVALRDAFNAARRQLQDRVRVRRGQVKQHDVPLHGRIAVLDCERGFGFIAGADGRELYFHRNSVINADFDRLEPGMEVRYRDEQGEQGPQATSVQVMGAHRVVGCWARPAPAARGGSSRPPLCRSRRISGPLSGIARLSGVAVHRRPPLLR